MTIHINFPGFLCLLQHPELEDRQQGCQSHQPGTNSKLLTGRDVQGWASKCLCLDSQFLAITLPHLWSHIPQGWSKDWEHLPYAPGEAGTAPGEGKTQEGPTNVDKSLMGQGVKKTEPDPVGSSQWQTKSQCAWTGQQGIPQKHKKNTVLDCDWTVEHISQRNCEISILGAIQNLTACVPLQLAPGDPAWGTEVGPENHQRFPPHSACLWFCATAEQENNNFQYMAQHKGKHHLKTTIC